MAVSSTTATLTMDNNSNGNANSISSPQPPPPTTAVITHLAPAIAHSASLLSSTALFLILRTSILTHLLLKQSLYASQIVALQGLWASAVVGRHSWGLTRRGCRALWKRSERMRDRVFFEFMVWILNPNALALLIFWPGWILVGCVYGVWSWAG